MHPVTLPRTTALIEQGIRENFHFGAQVFVAHQGRCVADLAFGEARPGLAMRTDTSQFWFSCTKPVTAVALCQQLERGRLQLNDPVRKFVPEFGCAGKENITLAHLLTHTGGFRSANQIDLAWSWDQVIAFICAAPLEADWIPGKRAGYHPTASWYLLGEIVRRLDGRPFAEYVREEIFLPLDLKGSWLGMPSAEFQSLGDRRGDFFEMRPGISEPIPVATMEYDSTSCRPGGNARGPVRELGQFLEMLRQGGEASGRRILLPETVTLMQQRHRAGLYDETFLQYMDWGLGLLLNTRHPGQPVLSYGFGRYASLEAFGHGGMQTSIAFVDPEHELSIAWICNGMCGERLHRQRNHELNSAIYEDLGLAAL
jgi:CubicO group peptidase (beta-lactamase class C family)